MQGGRRGGWLEIIVSPSGLLAQGPSMHGPSLYGWGTSIGKVLLLTSDKRHLAVGADRSGDERRAVVAHDRVVLGPGDGGNGLGEAADEHDARHDDGDEGHETEEGTRNTVANKTRRQEGR